MEKAYVGMMGGYAVLKDGDEKHKASHIVLTIDEYNTLIREKKSLKSQLDEEKTAHTNDVNEINRKAVAYKKKVEEDAQAVKNTAEKRVAAAEAETERQTNLNKNLLRTSTQEIAFRV